MSNKELTILWDFDGTLFDTYPVFAKIFKKVLNNEDVSENEIFKQLKISFRHASNYFHLSPEQWKECSFLEDNIALEEWKPFDDVEDVLKKARKNVIMTHKERNDVQKILHYYDWEKYFSEVVAGDDGFPRKPDKTSYEYLHKRHSIDLAIGDRELDIIPAKEIGIATCLFQNNESDIADFYLDNYKAFWDNVNIN